MKKNVTVTVTLDQIRVVPETGESEEGFRDERFVSTVESEGELFADGEKITIVYLENEITGLPNCETTLSFPTREPGRVTMSREGLVRTVLMFSEGERYLSVYETEYGSFELGVVTEKCENTVTPDGGDMNIIYTVELRGARAERNEISIKIRTVES